MIYVARLILFGFNTEADKERQLNESLKDGMLEFPGSGNFIAAKTLPDSVTQDIVNVGTMACAVDLDTLPKLPNDGTARSNPTVPSHKRPLTEK